jgi:hypothetical protein
MSEEEARRDHEDPKDEVEAHQRRTAANEEPQADSDEGEESDEVEAHQRRTV